MIRQYNASHNGFGVTLQGQQMAARVSQISQIISNTFAKVTDILWQNIYEAQTNSYNAILLVISIGRGHGTQFGAPTTTSQKPFLNMVSP